MLFHCRLPVPLKSGVNGKGKIIILCVLCASSEAGGKYKIIVLQHQDPPLCENRKAL